MQTDEHLIAVAVRAGEATAAIAGRDEAIRAARTAGQSLRQIATASGLSKDTVATITRGAPYGVQ